MAPAGRLPEPLCEIPDDGVLDGVVEVSVGSAAGVAAAMRSGVQ
ncbi:hypothetical protein [Actinoallomurus sp. NPDC050550]